MELPVAICTYRRENRLVLALDSLARQTDTRFRTVIVDNAGTAACRKQAERYEVAYTVATPVGLSHARNHALRTATTPWVLFFDDDAIADPTIIATLRDSPLHDRYPKLAAVGGYYEHYFDLPPPRWLSYYYREPVRPSPSPVDCLLPPGRYLVGGMLAVDRRVALGVGGFDPELGMRGTAFGYAEENRLQDAMRAAGYAVGYVPRAGMRHLVAARKYSVGARYEMALAQGKSQPRGNYGYGRAAYDLGKAIIHALTIDTARAARSYLGASRNTDSGPTVRFLPQNVWVNLVQKVGFIRGRLTSRP